jgi:hypothetical protein
MGCFPDTEAKKISSAEAVVSALPGRRQQKTGDAQ